MSIAESEKIWVAYCDPEFYGPLSAVEIKQFMREQKIKDDDCLWKKGWSQWKQPKSIPMFAYECKQSIGNNRPLVEISVPNPEDFKKIITPKVSSSDIETGMRWDAKRIAIVGGSTMLFGVAGAIVSGSLTKNRVKDNEIQKAEKFINEKNK